MSDTPSLNQPSLLQFFRPQRNENQLPANGPKKRDSPEQGTTPDKSIPISSSSSQEPEVKRRKLAPVRRLSRQLVQSSSDEQPEATSEPLSQLMSQDGIGQDSDGDDLGSLMKRLDDQEEDISDVPWYQKAVQQGEFWTNVTVEDTGRTASSSVSEAFALKTLDVEEESELESKYNLYINQVPIAKGPQSRFWKAFVEAYYDGIQRYKFPRWIDPDHLRDWQGLPPTDPKFDSERIRVNLDVKPADADKLHYTPAMQQYWQLKKDHFNKMIFFKLGKFYEIFYTDACILQPICDLKWMGSDEKAHVGFPESSLQWYARKVIDAGFAVTVVEQMETPGELQERSKATANRPKAVHREVCEVYTRGTVAHQKMIGPNPVYLLSVIFEEQVSLDGCRFAFVLVDVATSEIFFGVEDDKLPGRQHFRTLLAHSTPAEVLMAKANLPDGIINILQSSASAPKLTYSTKGLNEAHCVEKVKQFLSQDGKVNETRYQEFKTMCEDDLLMCLSALLLCEYLKELLMDERVLRFAHIQRWQQKLADKKMVLDAAAMNALEILTSRSNSVNDNLLAVLNHCQSPFGTRLLRRWLSAPLTDGSQINERLDAVEYFLQHSTEAEDFRTAIKSLPDLERLTARTCSQALQGSRGAVFFTITAEKKIKQFLDLLDHFRNLQAMVDNWSERDRMDEAPLRLGKILSKQSQGGFFPNLNELIDSLIAPIDILGNGNYAPKAGVFVPYDEASELVEAKKVELQTFLDTTLFQDILGLDLPDTDRTHVCYRDVKFRYEVEVPEPVWQKIEARKRKGLIDVTVTSQKKDFKRFHVAEIKELVSELEMLETKRSNELYPFMQALFTGFNDNAQAFAAATSLVAEIDVLICFAYVSELTQVSCRPVILETEQCMSLSMKCGYHPLLARKMDGFIPNDVELGTDLEPATSLILTGPNMGGKSTLARQVALCVLMAQIGCYVPAQAFELTPFDRIFARVGAHDAILEGKSTFYVELEETNDILQMATDRSLCIIDEFGRGTSIEEGAALAQATIRYITQTIKAACLFSTHFQEQLHSALKDVPKIGFWHMAASVDEASKEIVFLYRLTKGLCPDSHGLKVARIAGVPLSVLDRAERIRELASMSGLSEGDGREHSAVQEGAGEQDDQQQT